MEMSSFGMTDVGLRREKNEDSYLVNTEFGLYVVADGMGGHLGGDYASKLAVITIEEIISNLIRDPEMTLQSDVEIKSGDYQEYLKYAISIAGNRIYERAQNDPLLHGMGTTAVCVLFREGLAYIANVGDSRCYLVRNKKIKQLTEDHSLINDQIRSGVISSSEAKGHRYKNIITRSVGFQNEVEADIIVKTLKAGDKFLLCTDGLTNMVAADEIRKAVSEQGIREACRNLIELANQRGGDDNITIIITEILSAGPKQEDDTTINLGD